MQTALKFNSNMKKHVVNLISSAGLLEFLDTLHTTNVQDSFDWLSMGLSLVLYEGFRTVFGYKKRKQSHFPKYSYQIFWKNTCCSFQKMNSSKIYQRSYIFWFGNLAKLECADIRYIRGMNGRSTSSIIMKKTSLH